MNTPTRLIATLFAITCLSAAGAQERIVVPGQELLEVQFVEHRTTIETDPTKIDSLVHVRTLEMRTYGDTVHTVTAQEKQVPLPIDSAARRGHYVEFHLGAGLGSTGYGLFALKQPVGDMKTKGYEGYEQAALSGVVQLQYAYFFHKNVGIGIGAWLAEYTSYGHLDGKFVYPNQLDDDTGADGLGKRESYEHHTDITNWRERQTIHMVGVPVSLQFQAWGKRNRAGFFFDLGAAPTYTIKTDYRVLSGEIEHWGLYRGNVPMHDKPDHGFLTIPYDKIKNTSGKNTLRQIGATGFADLGLLVRMSLHTDLLIGVYAHYAILDMQQGTPRELGWKDDQYPNQGNVEYSGMLSSNCVSNLHPWEAGVKLGIHWHSLDKPQMTTEQFMDTTIHISQRVDSIWSERIDTLERQGLRASDKVQMRIDKLNRIYFGFDSYVLTAESKRSLDHIAEQLKTIPNKVILGGHASKEGTRVHNHRLALNRAMVVKYYLMDRGVPGSRLLVRDYGATTPNAINTNNDLTLDRRVEIIVLE